MSKMTLGQRKLPTLGQRSILPKSYVGPKLSCYLGSHNEHFRFATRVIRVTSPNSTSYYNSHAYKVCVCDSNSCFSALLLELLV